MRVIPQPGPGMGPVARIADAISTWYTFEVRRHVRPLRTAREEARMLQGQLADLYDQVQALTGEGPVPPAGRRGYPRRRRTNLVAVK
jgi:hypothetical protein